MKLIAFILTVLVAAPSSASAQTMNFEQAAAFLAESCGKDIDEMCRGISLDASRLRECLRRNGDSVSPRCQQEYPRAINAIDQRVTARANLVKLCNWELNRLCGEVRRHPVKGLQCLMESKKNTPNCNKAIEAAGYR